MSLILKIVVVSALILFLPGLPPYVQFQTMKVVPPLPLQGPLSPGKFALNNVEKLFVDQLVGPEGLEASPTDCSVFYSTVQAGDVLKFTANGSRMETLTKFGDSCAGLWDPSNCGRPLGIRFDSHGDLIVSDAYYGIYRINLTSGETINLVSKTTVVDGKTAKIFNAVAPAKDGRIFYTATSTNYHFNEALGEFFSAPSGRLLVYDPAQQRSQVLQERIHFANGVILSPDEDFAVVAECLQYRLLKHWLKGPRKGTTEVFIEGLPGTPDNLSHGPNGNMLVSLVSVRLPGQFNPIEFMYAHPWLRKFVLRVLHLIKLPLDLADSYLNLTLARYLAHHVLNLDMMRPFFTPHSIVFECDWDGRIIRSWHSNLPDIGGFSEAQFIGEFMYLGSPYNPFLGRVKLNWR